MCSNKPSLVVTIRWYYVIARHYVGSGGEDRHQTAQSDRQSIVCPYAEMGMDIDKPSPAGNHPRCMCAKKGVMNPSAFERLGYG